MTIKKVYVIMLQRFMLIIWNCCHQNQYGMSVK